MKRESIGEVLLHRAHHQDRGNDLVGVLGGTEVGHDPGQQLGVVDGLGHQLGHPLGHGAEIGAADVARGDDLENLAAGMGDEEGA